MPFRWAITGLTLSLYTDEPDIIVPCSPAGTIIMMSQNRQEDKDRKRSENDYLINLKAEMQIRSINQKIDLLLEEEIRTLFEIQQKQYDLLKEINAKLGKAAQTGTAC